MNRIPLATLAVLAAMSMTTAQAATATTCAFGTDPAYDMTEADVYTTTACVGPIDGNDSESAVASLFGVSGWTFSGKVEVPDPLNGFTQGADGLLMMTRYSDGKAGTWSVSSWTGIAEAMIVLKGSSNFAAYLVDMSAGLGGEWATRALLNNGGNQSELSHISLYTVAGTVSPPPPPEVPLPAAGLLLLGALGGLGLWRRRAA